MRSKLEKTMSKMYLPSQDEVIEDLAGDILERGELNIMAKAGGHMQEFELSHAVNQGGAIDITEGGLLSHDETDMLKAGNPEANKKWLEELAKADERGNRFRLQLEESKKRKAEVEEKLTQFEKQVHVRDEEIKRLNQLYQGGSNLEALSVKHTHETNEKTIGKLAN
jgi:DNA repair exonuclease SbcCD ATPase subunit